VVRAPHERDALMALSLLTFLGLRYPVRMLPILLSKRPGS
jgi:hypothetical protein